MTLPLLYKKTKTNAIQTYQVSTQADIITVIQGQLEGKKQSYTTKCLPKNLGRSNATTGSQQAKLECQSKWNAKIKAGYSQDPSGTLTVQLPQKVKVYQDQLKNIKFPCYSTPKLNGVNGTYWLINNELKLTSRGGEELPPIPHLESEVRQLMKLLKTDCLNGELYIHGQHLQDITSAVKKPKDLSKQLEFYIFEYPNINKTYQEKIEWINSLNLVVHDTDKVRIIGASIATSHKDIENLYNWAMKAGLEGTVIYNANAKYQFNTRSSDVFKYKKTQDAEYRVVSYTLDKYNHPIYLCITPEGKTFKVKRKGTAQERLADAVIAETNIGKWLNVEYEVLSKDKKPLKPIGNHFREMTPEGKPNE